MIPTATFYSFKGGLGRSAALANVAAFLALEKGHTVVALDMDLEAPGLGMWLPPLHSRGENQLGLLDLIDNALQNGRLPNDLSPYLYEADLSRGRSSGRVYVIGSGAVQRDYPRRITSLNWEAFFEGLDAPGFFDALQKKLEENHGVDRVLVDARTGFSDPAAIAVRSLASLVVLVFRPDEQNLQGLEVVLDSIREDQKNRPSLQYQLVASPLPVCRPDSEEERLQERALLDAVQRLRLVTVGEQEDQVDDPAELAALVDQSVLRVRWQEALALTTRPVIRPGRTDDFLALDYRELGARVEELLSVKATAPQSDDWSQPGRRGILGKELGSTDAREDSRRAEAFVRTNQVEQALERDTSFVFASKGAGKTAIFLQIVEKGLRGRPELEVVPIHGEVPGLTVLASEDLPDQRTEEAFEQFWLAYMAVRLRAFRDQKNNPSALSLSELRSRIKETAARDCRVEFDEAARDALEAARDHDILLLVDATERLFGDRPLDQAPSFRGLARAWLAFRSAVPRLHLKAFIRLHALLDETGTLIDRSHVQARSIELGWDELDAWWFLLRRLLQKLPEGDLPRAVHRGLLEALNHEERPDPGYLPQARDALETIFPKKVYPGEHEASFPSWLYARIRDGTGNLYPRALLTFARKCQELEKRNPSVPSRSVFDAATVRDAFVEASREHADAVLAELGYLRPYLEAIAHDPFQSSQVRYRERELLFVFEHKCAQQKPLVPPEVALNTLRTLGILRYGSDRRWHTEVYDYDVPPLFRFKLVPSPKGRV
jgi:MinD-like ATPase involved in chromosome partitioning or flagellar assembly